MISDVLLRSRRGGEKKSKNKTDFHLSEWLKRKIEKFKHIPNKLKRIFSRETIIKLQAEGEMIKSMVSFFGLILIFLLELIWKGIRSIKPFFKVASKAETFWKSRVGKKMEGLISRLESERGGVRRSFLIALAFRNMRAKKTRSYVTIGGVGLGIAVIVFLVSIGYGVERLVVKQVARLDDLKMADVLVGKSSNLKLNDKSLQVISNIPKVKKLFPMVSLVGKISYNGSVSESVLYGVTSNYLNISRLNKVKGKYFETADYALGRVDPRVAGKTTDWQFETAKYGLSIRTVRFNLYESSWLRVRSEPRVGAKILGYVQRQPGWFDGVEVWGGEFSGSDEGRIGKSTKGKMLGKWIEAPLPLWGKDDASGEYVPILGAGGDQDWQEGYVAEYELVINEEDSQVLQMSEGQVLGESVVASDSSAVVVGTDEQGVEWVELVDSSASNSAVSKKTLSFDKGALKEAVVNRAFIEMLGLESGKAIGESFEISLVILKDLGLDLDGLVESEKTNYTIVGVVENDKNPIIYVPLQDVQGLGITEYSQVKLLAKDEGSLIKIREQIDGLGYKTTSVVDTVNQIYRLFGSVRVVLMVFGLVALAVASLGMFNTMTVSLMERTREVGVMKAMGMKSNEVRELFLAEAMVMGFMGGVIGIVTGLAMGKLLSLVLSVFAIAKGLGFIDVSYIPWLFTVIVLLLSFVVGIITGIYPAKRATKISALDALRYE